MAKKKEIAIKYKANTFRKMMKELENDRKKHPIYYFFHDLYYRIYNYITDLKWKIPNYWQRSFNGYGFADIWDFDTYLARVIVGGIKHLKKTKIGIPNDIVDKYNHNFKKGEKDWDNKLDKIIRTFEIHLLWTDKTRFPTEKERKQYEEGWKLFQEYFGNLWD